MNRKGTYYNRKLALTALAALMLAALLLFSACAKNGDIPAIPIGPETAVPEAAASTPPDEPIPTPTPEPTPEPYSFVEIPDDPMRGVFQLVNYSHACTYIERAGAEVLPLRGNTGRALLLTNNDHALAPTAAAALDGFAAAFFEQTGGDRLLVTSSFRTLEYQQRVYNDYVQNHGEEMARIYVADPGYSEHHTGLAVDLSTMSAGGERIPLIEHARFSWVTEHCSDYGFILRYPVGTEAITHVAYEPWHFRYLGVPMAKAVFALGMTYDEFMEHIKQYSLESGMLYLSEELCCPDVASIGALPESGYLIYFVPTEPGETVRIPVLNCENSAYQIGNANDGGYIVLIHIGGPLD